MDGIKKVVKWVLYVLLFFVIGLILLIVKATLSDYKPADIENIAQDRGDVVYVTDTFNVFNWNIGYCGLGEDMSFFYDGGEKVRTDLETTQDNLVGIIEELTAANDIDFYLLQEVDVNSRRSYRINQLDELRKVLKEYTSFFAHNYKVWFVPIPLSNPYGKVESGLASFSKLSPFDVNRHSFPGNYSWPTGLFMLDRCFMVQRFYTSNGKELVLINTHNSAYDDGSLRKQQMKSLRYFLVEEYELGNYVVVGGDWNQYPPKLNTEAIEEKEMHLTRLQISSEFMPEGWTWTYSDSIPTNRMLYESYRKDTTEIAIIDYFLCSPNVQALEHSVTDLQFKNSDHQPVLYSFTFKP